MLGLQLDAKMMKEDVIFVVGWETYEKGVRNTQDRVSA